jgi:citrate synthase
MTPSQPSSQSLASSRSAPGEPPANPGLEGVVAAETSLSRIDGEAGRLVLRGHALQDLAGQRSFEEVVALLWTGSLDGRPGLGAELGAARVAAHAQLGRLGDSLLLTDGMDALRAALSHGLPPAEGLEGDAGILGAVAVYAAAWWRRQEGAEPLEPDPSAGHAADTLRLLAGEAVGASAVSALETYLVTVCDHGLNASTFTARVVASTLADPLSAVVAALGALKGPLHGGAPGPVLDMLDAVGSPTQAESWVGAELDAGRRIMGMGHRVYRVRDPRAAVLERAAVELGAARLGLAQTVERAAADALSERKPGRRLAANVEFYTAILLDAVGLDRRLFSPTFAVARTAGWLAHAREQVRTGRLIRPRARYVGPEPADSEGVPV